DALVLVFHDVHWADAGLLDFIEHLVDWARDVPILILLPAAPQVSEQRPNWWGKENSTAVRLSPLTNEHIAQLVAGVAPTTVPMETRGALVGRRCGSPLLPGA